MGTIEPWSFLDESVAYLQRFENDAPRLFANEAEAWDIQYFGALWNGLSDISGPHIVSIRDMPALENALSALNNASSIRYFIVHQKNSWDRFKVSQTGFSRIFGSDGIYPPFLDFVRAFGTKFDAKDEDFGGFNYRFRTATRAHKAYELCYNVRYVERHGREGEYPWSFRHTALYHKLDESTGTSMWVLLQPPEAVKRNLAKVFGSCNIASADFPSKTPLFTHLLILLITEVGWRTFLIEVEKDLEKLNDKALFSRVGRPAKFDYSVEFSESQELQVIRQRLLKAQSTIELSLKVAGGLRSFCERLRKDDDSFSKDVWVPELETYITRLSSHNHSLRRLLDVAQGTMTLLLKILDYRHDEAIRYNASATRDLLAAAQHERDLMKLIAQKTQQDSRSMKIVTFIAMIYLPATLVASIFSSSIVDSQDEGYLGFSATLRLAPFSIITICLTALTVIGAVIWDKEYLPLDKMRRSSSRGASP